PGYTIPVLIQLAILGSPKKRMTLGGIIEALENRFEWYRERKEEKDTAWKGSVRHSLSLERCFRKVQRPVTEIGKGHYWTVD
ncbi:uncharacterized protein BXZ73DRAFT_2099, partial [Epithele typhae]|uniref:uncharacterized protein n=1 Tax=Epithele typhae TaxID=378194 RepID=UPI0020076C2F